MTRANSQGLYLSEVNEPFPSRSGVLPLLVHCVCQEYLSSLWAMWPGHLVKGVCLPPESLPNINLITFQDLQGEGVKRGFPESN